MSTFYGQVRGSSQASATRTGTYKSGISASVQSYDGSLISRMRYDEKKNLIITLEVSDCSSENGRVIFDDSLDVLKDILDPSKKERGQYDK